ncbi:hypothetical protein C8R46DRAFT_1349233 [Mycena filopes]|nr:hypothetical protein C8R46DRAFT_1349233 [Mycena filopes]
MSAPFCCIGIYTVSTSLVKEHVDHKIQALANAIHEIAAERHGLRKYEMLIKNMSFDPSMTALGLAAAQPIVVMRTEFETAEQMFAFNDDREIHKHLAAAGEDFGLRVQDSHFSVDVETRINKKTHSRLQNIPLIGRLFAKKQRFRAIGIYRLPSQSDEAQSFKNKIAAALDQACSAIPVVRERLLQLEVLSKNTGLDSQLQQQGVTPADPTVLLWAESQSLEHMVEVCSVI